MPADAQRFVLDRYEALARVRSGRVLQQKVAVDKDGSQRAADLVAELPHGVFLLLTSFLGEGVSHGLFR